MHVTHFHDKKPMLLKGKLHQPCDYITKVKPSIPVTDGMTGMSLSANLQYKTSVAMDCVYQIMLNQNLSHKLEKVVFSNY
jgi:hypothetical protein